MSACSTGASAVDLSVPCPAPPHTLPAAPLCCRDDARCPTPTCLGPFDTQLKPSVEVSSVRVSAVPLRMSACSTGAGAVDLSVPCPAPPHTLSDTAVCAPLPTNAANTPAHTTRTLGTIERACLCCGDADQVADFTNLENDTHLHNSVDHGVTCWLQRATLFTTEAANTLDNNVYTSRLCSPSGG
jgi:hypothetical protein